MRSTIARLFGKSPFYALQTHMKKVKACIVQLGKVFDAVEAGKHTQLPALVKDLSKLEHEADLTKNDIRNHLPKSVFLPIDKVPFLEILSLQDCISDQAEEIGRLLVLYDFSQHRSLFDAIKGLYKKNIEAFWQARTIIKELDDLLESSFGGIEAEKVKAMVEQSSFLEYEVDKMKYQILQTFFASSEHFDAKVVYLFTRIIDEVNKIAHLSEKLANRIRMVLELK